MWLHPVPIGIELGRGGGACDREVRRIPLPRTPVNKGSKIDFRLSREGRLKGYGYGERLRMLPCVWRERRLSGHRRGAVVLLLCAQEEMAFRVRLLQCCPPSDGIGDHLARVPSRLRPCAHEDGAFLGPRPRASAVNFREPPTPEVRGTPKFSRNQTVASRTRLLHFLAPFVATWRGYRRRSGRWCHCVTIFGAQRREIATANFREFLFPDVG